VVLRELKRVTVEPVTKDEIKRAKEYYRGQLLFALEDTMSHMLWLGEKIMAQEKEIEAKNILDSIEKVTADDIMRVAGGIFRKEGMNLAVIGPLKDEKNVKEALTI
jgi:predicted Zn-dependent peptidase